MKQEDKELLFKDLCARLPYKVYAQIPDDYEGYISAIESVDIDGFVTDFEGIQMEIEKIKPYLLPFSSMGPEHYVELVDLGDETSNDCFVSFNFNQLDWLNAHHYDYRRLIKKGLALDATDKNIY